MKNISFSEKLIKLKEKIAERTSEIDRSKGRLSILQDSLKKLGFKNIDQAKAELKKIQARLEKKMSCFNLQIKNLKRRVENENN